jgi:hypothetical protein
VPRAQPAAARPCGRHPPTAAARPCGRRTPTALPCRPALPQVTDLAFLRNSRSGRHAALGSGTFAVCEVGHAPGEASSLTVEVGETLWLLPADAAAARVGDFSWVFPQEGGSYYVVVLAASTAPEAMGILEALLAAAALCRDAGLALGDVATQSGDACASGALERIDSAGHAAMGAIVEALVEADEGEATHLSPGLRRRMAASAAAAKAAARVAQGRGGGVSLCLCLGRAPSSAGPSRQWAAAEQAGMLVLHDARRRALERGEGSVTNGTHYARMDTRGGVVARAEAKETAARLLRQLARC